MVLNGDIQRLDYTWQKQGSGLRFKKSASRSSRITHTRRFNTYLLLFQDEKGPIAAKTYDGSSWSSVQANIEHDQPTRRWKDCSTYLVYTTIPMIKCIKREFIDYWWVISLLIKLFVVYDPSFYQRIQTDLNISSL